MLRKATWPLSCYALQCPPSSMERHQRLPMSFVPPRIKMKAGRMPCCDNSSSSDGNRSTISFGGSSVDPVTLHHGAIILYCRW